MKCFCFYIAFLWTFFSCQPRPSMQPLLEKADSLLSSNPDSVFLMLDTVADPEIFPKDEYAEWCLLLTQAEDKSGREHISEAPIWKATKYYREHGPTLKYAIALYTSGRVASELGRPIEAVQYYIEAEHVGREAKDYKLLFQITSNLGSIYRSLYWVDSTFFVYKRSLEYAKLSEDSFYIAEANSYIGSAYSLLCFWDKSHPYYKQAADMLRKMEDYENLVKVLNEWAVVSIHRKDFKQVNCCIQEMDSIPDVYKQKNNHQIYLVKGQFYLQTGKYDLADSYLQKAISSDNSHTAQDAYLYLYDLRKSQEKYKEATEYIDVWKAYNDSIYAVRDIVMTIPEQYERGLLKDKHEILQREYYFYIVISSLIILLFIFLYMISRSRFKEKVLLLNQAMDIIKNLNQKVQENERLIQKYEVLYDSLENSSLAENENMKHQLNDLEVEIEKLKADNIKLNKEIAEQKKKYRLDKILKTEQEVRKTVLLLQLKENPTYIEKEQWAELFLTMDLLFDNFTKRLKATYPELGNSDIQYCCLFKAGFSIQQIAVMLNVAPTTVSRRKLDIRKHMHLAAKEDVEKVCKNF